MAYLVKVFGIFVAVFADSISIGKDNLVEASFVETHISLAVRLLLLFLGFLL